MINEKDILKALSHIVDPDFNRDIVSLGFVKNIRVDGATVSLDIELTTPACPVKGEFQKEAERSILSLPGIKQVHVTMTSQPRRESPSLGNIESSLKTVKSIIAVSSCKGGVGKSTIAACLALELAQRGFKVGLIDADIYGPSIPTLLNLQQTPVYANEKGQLIPLEVNNLKVMSFGFFVGRRAGGLARSFGVPLCPADPSSDRLGRFGLSFYRYAAGNGGHSIDDHTVCGVKRGGHCHDQTNLVFGGCGARNSDV